MMVSKIAPHKTIISSNAQPMKWNLKKIKLHKKFSSNWNPKTANAVFCADEAGNRQTRYNAIPIKTYSKVQTGPNNQLGGLKGGLFKVAYQVPILLAVAYPEMPPTVSVMSKEINNFIKVILKEYKKCFDFVAAYLSKNKLWNQAQTTTGRRWLH